MNDRQRLAQIRAQLPVLTQGGYWNTGTAGPLPEPVRVAMIEQIKAESERGRIHPQNYPLIMERMRQIKEQLSRMFGGKPDEWALTHHTTEGINRVLMGFDWQEDDEIVTCNLEHPGVLAPLAVLRERFGVRVQRVDLGVGDLAEDPLTHLLAAVSPRTKLFALSHVSFSSGARLPLEELARRLRERGIPILVDGAQSAGSIPFKAPIFDFYAIPGQKWLLGPEGSGALFVREEFHDELRLSEAGYFTFSALPWDAPDDIVPNSGAGRFEVGTRNSAVLAGQLAALQWLENLGIEACTERTVRLAEHLRQLLMNEDGVEMVTPANHAGLLTFRYRGIDPKRLVAWLAERKQWIRTIDELGAVRISVGFFHDEAEVDAWPGLLREAFAALS